MGCEIMKKFLVCLQLITAILLLYLIFYNIYQSGELIELVKILARVKSKWYFITGSLFGFGICLFVTAARWYLLVRKQGSSLSLWDILKLTLVGQFYNAFILGSTGGDVVKAVYAAFMEVRYRAETTTTVVADRLIGMFVLVFLGGFMPLLDLNKFLAEPILRVCLGILIITSISFLVFFVVLLKGEWFKRLFLRIKLFKKASKITQLFERIYQAFHSCLTGRLLLTLTLLLSLCNHVVLIISIYFLLKGLGSNMGLLECFTVFPAINAFSSLPLTPGNLGARESIYALFLKAWGVPVYMAVSLSLIFYAVTLIWSVIGGIIYLFFIRRLYLSMSVKKI